MGNEFAKKGVDLRVDFNPMGELQKHTGKLRRFKINFDTKRHTETRKQSGVIGKAKRFFGQDWGTYEVDYETYTIY